MKFSIASWNVEGRLNNRPDPITGRGSWKQILTGVRDLNADIIFFCEARDENLELPEQLDSTFERLGYRIYDFQYEESNEIQEQKGEGSAAPVYRLASRLPLVDVKVVRLGDLRNGVSAIVVDPINREKVAQIFGIHLLDISEVLRQRQVPDLIRLINESSLPVIVLGDYNSMSGETKKSKLMRHKIVRWLVKNLIPFSGLRHFFVRASDMASGTVLARLDEETRTRDVDLTHRATATPRVREYWFLPSVRLIDIDHIRVSKDVKVRSFLIGVKDTGADHRPLLAQVEV